MSNNPLNTIVFDEAIASRGGFSGAINVPKQSPLFTYTNGRSLMFYIPPKDPQRNKFKSLIISNGGIIVDTKPTELQNHNDIIIVSTKPILDVLQDDGIYNVNFDFILNSLENGELESLEDYRYKLNTQETVIAPSHGQDSNAVNTAVATTGTGTALGGRGHNRFTLEKDEFILQQIRLNPRFRQSHRFFEELSQEPILKGHTGNSIRSRFRKHLVKKLLWVYSFDENNKVIKDNEGNPVKLGYDELPDTLKNKYTAHDDYSLCLDALAYIKEINSSSTEPIDINKKLPLPYSFFNDMFKKIPKHSLHSWRDRYRKFVGDGTLQSYITYYESSIANGVAPRTLTRVNEFSRSVQEFRDAVRSTGEGSSSSTTAAAPVAAVASPTTIVNSSGLPALNRKRKLDDGIADSSRSALDEEIGELKSSNIDATLFVKTAGDDSRKQAQAQARKARQQQERVLAAAVAVATAATNTNEDEESQDILKPIQVPKLTAQLGDDEDDEDDDGEDEIEDIETDNLTSSSNQTHSQPEPPFAQSTQQQPDEPSQYDTAPQAAESQSEEPFQLQYLDMNNVNMNDILLEKAINLLENNEFLSKVNEVTSPKFENGKEIDEDLADLVLRLESLGLTDKFLSHIILSCNADKLTIRFYLEIYISNFQKYLQSKADEMQFYETFGINHGEGIWNRNMDSFIGTRNEDSLLEVHSKSQLRARKLFLQDVGLLGA
ncbi:Rap1, DNA-binding-domain-containing protein [Scheffersomyces coipomensis]|uniref:Rap1, DNA-binding-domain-containing protein n=1 Tax=Scheffersomyces coipomensis TaxID=1788519 RepID=UPI00315C5E94